MSAYPPEIGDRRDWHRQSAGDPGAPTFMATIGVDAAVVKDLSLRGIALLTTHAHPIGSTVTVNVGRGTGRKHLLTMSVLHCEPAENGLVRIGGSFVDESSMSTARALLAGAS